MIKMWDNLFAEADPKIADLWQKLDVDCQEETVTQIYDAMHDYLRKVWQETYRVLVDGGIACINIGDATRSVNGKFQLYPNHSRITEIMRKNRLHHTTLHSMEETHNQTKIQRQRRLFRLRFSAAKRLRYP